MYVKLFWDKLLLIQIVTKYQFCISEFPNFKVYGSGCAIFAFTKSTLWIFRIVNHKLIWFLSVFVTDYYNFNVLIVWVLCVL